MLPFLLANLIPIEVDGSNHLVKSTVDSLTFHGGFVAVVEDGKSEATRIPASPPRCPYTSLHHRGFVEKILDKQSQYIFFLVDKNNAFVLLKQLENFTLRVYFHSFPPFHEIQVLGSFVPDSAPSTKSKIIVYLLIGPKNAKRSVVLVILICIDS